MNHLPVLHPAGVEALRDAPLAWALLIGACVLFIALMLLLALAASPNSRPMRRRWWLVGGGLLLPAVVLGALHAFNLRHIERLAPTLERDTLVVSLSGHLWWWELRYTDPATGATIASANELRLPVGRPVRLGLSSNDVIHSVWIPALAGKVDLVPGRVAQLQLQVNRAGVWRGPCAEFCGQAHARMVLHAVAEPAADFDAWLARQALAAREPSNPIEVRGRRAFVELRCGACHTVRGVATAVLPGPDLTHFASRLHIGAGTLVNEPAALRRWIADVQQHKPGARMPSFGALDEATLDALVAYLSSLR
jgi:cytochrome c oxidase subunit II